MTFKCNSIICEAHLRGIEPIFEMMGQIAAWILQDVPKIHNSENLRILCFPGYHVRAACPLADNEILEGVITAVSPDNTKVKVQAIGHDQSFKVLMKDLIPSRGKEAREKQVRQLYVGH